MSCIDIVMAVHNCAPRVIDGIFFCESPRTTLILFNVRVQTAGAVLVLCVSAVPPLYVCRSLLRQQSLSNNVLRVTHDLGSAPSKLTFMLADQERKDRTLDGSFSLSLFMCKRSECATMKFRSVSAACVPLLSRLVTLTPSYYHDVTAVVLTAVLLVCGCDMNNNRGEGEEGVGCSVVVHEWPGLGPGAGVGGGISSWRGRETAAAAVPAGRVGRGGCGPRTARRDAD